MESEKQSLLDQARNAQELAHLHSSKGEHEQGARWAEDGLKKARELGEPKMVVECSSLLAFSLMKLGDYDEAGRILENSLATARFIRDISLRGPALNALAIIMRRRGDLDRAYQLQSENLSLAQVQGERRRIAVARHDRALVLVNQGRLALALKDLEASQAAFDQLPDQPIGPAIYWALFYLELLHPAEVRRWAKLALEEAMVMGDRETESDACSLLGRAALLEGKGTEAGSYSERALRVAEEISDPQCQMEALWTNFLSQEAAGRVDEAGKALVTLEGLVHSTANLEQRIQLAYGRARLGLMRGEIDQAAAHLIGAREIVERHVAGCWEWRIAACEARVRLELRDEDGARCSLESARETLRRLAADLPAELHDAFLEAGEKSRELAEVMEVGE